MNFIKTYSLKQQTPLIHFQYDQDGATLRATEVKPKLDRYIREIYRREHNGTDVPQSWCQGDKGALCYRMSIQCERIKTVDLGLRTDYDIYYGNMGGNIKKGVMSTQITLRLVCRNSDLLKMLDSHIKNFFIVHNFGTMQRKGFGSFLIGNPSQEEITKALCSWYGAKHCYSFDGGEKPFQRIKTIYSIMKSGINFGGYRRSLLFLFMHQKYQMGNEKAWLKTTGMAPAIGTHRHVRLASNQNAYYVRALLGTGERLTFINDPNNRRDKSVVNVSNPAIARFKSPILFKIIGNTVYYVCEVINPAIYGRSFVFQTNYRAATMHAAGLTVPQRNQVPSFEDDFMEFCYNELNLSQPALDRKYPNSGYKALSGFRGMQRVKIFRH